MCYKKGAISMKGCPCYAHLLGLGATSSPNCICPYFVVYLPYFGNKFENILKCVCLNFEIYYYQIFTIYIYILSISSWEDVKLPA